MPRQTPRTMAQRAMACDWPLLRLVGFCLAEAWCELPLVEMPVGVQDTCHMSCASWWHRRYSRVELMYSTVIAEGIPPC